MAKDVIRVAKTFVVHLKHTKFNFGTSVISSVNKTPKEIFWLLLNPIKLP